MRALEGEPLPLMSGIHDNMRFIPGRTVSHGRYLFAMGVGERLRLQKTRATTMHVPLPRPSSERGASWGAVLSMSLCVVLIV